METTWTFEVPLLDDRQLVFLPIRLLPFISFLVSGGVPAVLYHLCWKFCVGGCLIAFAGALMAFLPLSIYSKAASLSGLTKISPFSYFRHSL